MELRNFEILIASLQEQHRRVDIAYNLKIDVVEFSEPLHRAVDLLVKEIYGEEGYSWFSWFCYDSDYGNRDWSKLPCFTSGPNGKIIPANKKSTTKYGAFDASGNPICYSVKTTWEFLENNFSKTSQKKTKSRNNDMKNALKIINGNQDGKSKL